MAADLERLVVQLSADVKQYQNALNKAQGFTNQRARQIEGRFAKMQKSISGSFAGSFGKGLVGGIAAGFSAQAVKELLDAGTRIQNALKTAGLEGSNLTKVYDQLFAAAQRNGAPIESLVNLYSKLSLVSGELGVKQDDLVKFTDNVAVALRAGGADAQAASGALLQLTQALGGGVIRAEEFNSVLEGAPTILQQAAAGLKEADGSVAKLRQIMLDGKLSSKAFFDAFQAGAPVMAERAGKAELTISSAFVRLQNVLVDAATKFNDASGASGAFADVLNSISDYIASVDFQSLVSEINSVGSAFNRAVGEVQSYARAIAEATGGAAIGDYLATTRVGEAIGIRKDINTRIRQGDATDTNGQNPALQQALKNRYGGSGEAAAKKGGRLTADAIDAKAAEAIKKVSIEDYDIPSSGKASKAASSKIKQAAEKAARELDSAIASQTGVAVDVVTNMLGMSEKKNSGNINAFLRAGGVNLDAAQKAWCAAFVNSALAQVGVTGSGSQVATSFANWGAGVKANQVQRGDVMVQMRGNQAGDTGGHVGFATGQVRMQQGILQLQQISGNASNQVKEEWINASDTIIRRATEAMQLPADGLKNLSDTSQAVMRASEESAQRQMEMQQQMGQIANTVFDGLVNALADGKIEGQELLQILMSVVQQLMQMQGFGGISGGGSGGGLFGFLGNLFGGGSIASGIPGPWGATLHSGGTVGTSGLKRKVNPAMFAGAPRMHSGGVAGLRHDEVAAILQKGEVVIPKNMRGSKSASNSSQTNIGSISIRVDDQGNAMNTGDQTALGRNLTAAVQQEIVRQQRPGGLLAGTARR